MAEASKKFSLQKALTACKKSLPVVGICVLITSLTLAGLWQQYRGHNGMLNQLVSTLELKLLDWRFVIRGSMKPSGKVGILAIDERSIQKFGRWPIARKYYEQAFNNLKKLGVHWMAFDVVWSERERPLLEDATADINLLQTAAATKNVANPKIKDAIDRISVLRSSSPGEQSLARGIHNFHNIVLGYFYFASKKDAAALGKNPFAGLDTMLGAEIQALVMPDGADLKNYPALAGAGAVGNIPAITSAAENYAFFNNESDEDAIMRWVTLVRSLDGHLMPSLSLKLAAQAAGREIVVFFDKLGIEEIVLMNPEDDKDLIKIPVDSDGLGRILINHLGPGNTIPHFSLAAAYENSFTEKERKLLKGRSLILGPTAIAINDQRANPFDPGINGVENHAAVVDNILSGRMIRRPADIYKTELLLVAAIGVLFAPFLMFSGALSSGLAALFFFVGYYYLDKVLWFGKGTWVYMGVPLLEIIILYVSVTIYKYVVEEREKRKVKSAFQHYLSPDVMHQVLDDPSKLKLGGERKECTVFFSDVRGFTTISESLPPEKLCELMNDYLGPMTGIVLRSGGVLDKYIGDAIMAFWGAPIDRPDQADVAATACIQMMHELERIRHDFPKKNFPPVDIGCGLNTGPMSVGNMGSQERFAYTVMGDSVNLAARLESITKEYGVRIIISENTHKRVTPGKFMLRDLDDIVVKGKKEPVRIYELMHPFMVRDEQTLKNLQAEFEAMRLAYKKQDWSAAKKHLKSCLLLRPEDGPTKLYLERIEELEQAPRIDNWDGVHVFKHK